MQANSNWQVISESDLFDSGESSDNKGQETLKQTVIAVVENMSINDYRVRDFLSSCTEYGFWNEGAFSNQDFNLADRMKKQLVEEIAKRDEGFARRIAIKLRIAR